jgi:hypothetical protein
MEGEFKYVLMPTGSSGIVLWENGENRKLARLTPTNDAEGAVGGGAEGSGGAGVGGDHLRHELNVAP